MSNNAAASSNEAHRVGHMPPRPPTLRARIGAVLVKVIRRALFWYTEQINRAFENLEQELKRITTDVSVLKQDFAGVQRREAKMREHFDLAITALEQDHADHEDLADQIRSLEVGLKSMKAAVEEGKGALRQELAVQLHESVQRIETFTFQTRATLQSQQSRISLLMSRRIAANGSASENPDVGSESSCAELGPLYAHFQDAVRGTRSEIKKRVAEYLAVLEQRRLGRPHMPVLDLGCGRGEWLEVLAENGLTALGVDSNATFIEDCRERGLNVRMANLLTFLQGLPEQSQGAVTAFHVVENMSFPTLLRLLDETVRVLKPGGVLVLETPNPENLIVGAHTFYLDPMRVRPLPAELLRLQVESRGFYSVEVRRLHPFPDSFRVQEDTKTAAVLNEVLYGPRDYAIVAERS
jgi:ubiquinone/menaquinone biosynthesis C-methylase UbiE